MGESRVGMVGVAEQEGGLGLVRRRRYGYDDGDG